MEPLSLRVINIIEHLTKDWVIRTVPLSLKVINIKEHLTKDWVMRMAPLSLKVINIIEQVRCSIILITLNDKGTLRMTLS
jgi:hypothetical protein